LKARLGARVEHPFRVLERKFACTSARYRGMAKNAARVLTLFALSYSDDAGRRFQLMPATDSDASLPTGEGRNAGSVTMGSV